MEQNYPTSFDGKKIAALLTAEDVAEVLNISRSYAFELLQRGDIPKVKIGRATRVRPCDLEDFIKRSMS
jgi:excisionase family DNA binding protein